MWFSIAILIIMLLIVFRYFHVTISGTRILNNELKQQADGLQMQLEQLTEKEAKARREADLSLNAKGKILSAMSHEIRTPMNGVIGMVTLLAETELNTEQREYAETILSCSKNLLTNVNEILINDMLDFSKIDLESMELTNKSLDLRNCIEEVLNMFAGKSAEAGVDILYQINEKVPLQIIGDYKRLQQVLINLVENAIRFTKNGEVLISVDVISDTFSDQLKLGFTISDTGTGISEAQMQLLFKGILPEDYSTKSKQVSKGFGLVICKRLVEQMGGQISVINRPGKGCTFSFSILCAASQSASDFTNNKMIGFEGKQILIVDDNVTANNILNNQMEQWKLLPVIATSGKQAQEILSQISVDVVITDATMPEMDGIELSQYIKSHYPKIPVILLNPVNDERHKEHATIFSAVLTKPVKQHMLFDTILSILRHKDKAASNKDGAHKMPDNFSEKYPLHILVAEDNPVNQKWIKKILSKMGYETNVAENGKIVLERVGHENFDLILMDVQMPEMDGMEATRMIRLCLETQPVIIAMTANVMQGDREACMQSGMNDYISKPVELNELINMLEKWALLIKEKKQVSLEIKKV